MTRRDGGARRRVPLAEAGRPGVVAEVPRSSLSAADRAFIDDFVVITARWGMATAVGRVLGYLMLRDEPTGLDRIAIDLEMSKAGAWNAARHLEQVGEIRRFGERGSKRGLFAPTEQFEDVVLRFGGLLGAVGRLMRDAGSRAAPGKAAARFGERSAFYLAMETTITDAIDALGAERRAARRRDDDR